MLYLSKVIWTLSQNSGVKIGSHTHEISFSNVWEIIISRNLYSILLSCFTVGVNPL
jgi:hypothetical protein